MRLPCFREAFEVSQKKRTFALNKDSKYFFSEDSEYFFPEDSEYFF